MISAGVRRLVFIATSVVLTMAAILGIAALPEALHSVGVKAPRTWEEGILDFLVSPARADEVAPDALMKRVSDEVIAALRQQKDVRGLVEAKILPHFDARRATQSAVGASWRRATPEQQEQLVREFTRLLVRTYSGALANYRDQTIEFMPLRAAAGDTEVTVRSRIRQPGAEAIVVEYDLAKSEGGWKVYDLRVAGVSLVATYRTSFAEEVRNRGIDGLISTLSARNRA